MKHPRTEPRPGSRADVASDLPATKARNPPCKKTGTKTGAATKEAARKARALHHVEYNHTPAHRRNMSTQTRTQGCFIHILFSYTHGAFGAFICRDGCVGISVEVVTGMVVSMSCMSSTVDVKAQVATCTKAHR